MVAFLQKFIRPTNENVLGEQMRTKLNRICWKTRVVFFETSGHLWVDVWQMPLNQTNDRFWAWSFDRSSRPLRPEQILHL
jgi:hypothetical protein